MILRHQNSAIQVAFSLTYMICGNVKVQEQIQHSLKALMLAYGDIFDIILNEISG